MIRNPRWARFWPDATVIRLATIGSLGSLKAPGTWGTAAGMLFYYAVVAHMSLLAGALLLALCAYLAIGICGEAEKRLKKVDPGEIILDEFVAMPIGMLGMEAFVGHPHYWTLPVIAFALFRVLDIWKPLGIRSLQRYYGGFGVVADDIAAGVAVCLIMNVGARLAL